ncbi:MAG: glycosyltransferase family 2 protein [Planctomycetes bacterium]|nr:glycosyltransferase family 2 protein [Planctomycetota bacterium]
MSAPRFSVVVPTRERADTLRFALRTCLDQDFDDYEVIVSDNHSSPATRAVVDEFASPKVGYVRTEKPVAMSTNWEFAVGHARGEYVILIGDDDGLLPHALRELDRLACDTGARAIRWTAAYYTWPTVAVAGQGNYLRVPLGREVCERDGADVIREVAEFRAFYTDLPMLYNAAVHRDVLDALRARAGRVFPHPVPDVYSGFAVAYAAGRFLSATAPMSVSGQSRASNGLATLFFRGRSATSDEFFALNAADGLHSEHTVPDVPVFPHVPVADSFAFAKRVLFPDLPVELDRKALAAACVTGARVTEADWPAALAAVRAAFADDAELEKWFDAELAHKPYAAPPPVRLRPDRLTADGTALHLDAAAFGVSDVAGAGALCERLLGYRAHGLALKDAEHVPDGLAELQAKEAYIQRLAVLCQDLHAQLHATAAHRDVVAAHLRAREATLAEHQRQIRDLIARLNVRGLRSFLSSAFRRIVPKRAPR